jgi:hypothetical protein
VGSEFRQEHNLDRAARLERQPGPSFDQEMTRTRTDGPVNSKEASMWLVLGGSAHWKQGSGAKAS